MADKLVQRDFFNAAIVNFGGEVEGEVPEISNEAMVEFFKSRIEILNNKKSSAKTKSNEANESIKANILEVLGEERMTVTEILTKMIAEGRVPADTSGQKISAMMRQLRDKEGKVDKVKDGKRMVFFAVEG